MPEQVPRILIVEDEKPMARVLMHKFNAAGLETVHIMSGDLVIPQLQSGHFDLVLLDLMIPEMDGFEVLQKVAELNLNIPIIVLSNLAQNEDIVKAKRLGAKDYLVKVRTTPADILEEVKKYLGSS
jgi:DNA-binding response OmpR family regulator